MIDPNQCLRATGSDCLFQHSCHFGSCSASLGVKDIARFSGDDSRLIEPYYGFRRVSGNKRGVSEIRRTLYFG